MRSFRPPSCPSFATIARLQNRDRSQRVAVEKQARQFHVSGRVQGVGFRFFVERMAAKLSVGGYVKNLFDGRVEVYAIGAPEQLEALKEALRRGPPMADVDRVDEEDAAVLRDYETVFTIERDE